MFNGVDDFVSLPIHKDELLNTLTVTHANGKYDVKQAWDQHLGGRRPIHIHVVCTSGSFYSTLNEQFRSLGAKIERWKSDTGEKTFERARNVEPHAILIDETLPDVDPYELIARFQTEMPTLPIILMAEKTTPDYLKMTIRNPMYGYLEKPFSKLKLLKALLTVTKKP